MFGNSNNSLTIDMLSWLSGSQNKLNEEFQKRAQNAANAKSSFGKSIENFQKTSAAYTSPRINKEYYNKMIERLDPAGNKTEVQKIKSYLHNFHVNFEKQSDLETNKYSDNDTGIFSYIEQDTAKQLKEKYDSIKEQNKDMAPEVRKVIEDVNGTMKDVFMKYRYFEYKYVQTNIVLLDFIHGSREIFQEYSDYTTKFAAQLVMQNMKNMKTILETVLQLQANNDEKRLDKQAIDQVAKMMEDQTKASSDEYQKLLEKNKDMVVRLQETIKDLASKTVQQDQNSS